MIAYKVKINGEEIVVAGQEDWSVLTTHILATRKEEHDPEGGRIQYSTTGLSHSNQDGYGEHFRWGDRELKAGDVVSIEIVSTESPSTPIKRYRSDKIVQENPFTEEEIKEMKYRHYIELKKEFEN